MSSITQPDRNRDRSGAAFPTLLSEALIARTITQGLPYAFAERAAKGVVAGANQLFAKQDQRDRSGDVDYRGTTTAALQAMLDRGFNEAVASGLELQPPRQPPWEPSPAKVIPRPVPA
ncbi:hypothetical protein EET67_18505 [Pseudaminobacter arsenicus]|uniref:Pyrroline-5-carboxylate reductase dimerisation domain-containing protein n=1 Tax=Borborobacter arsenicus TaxID=1851146 RepID=A0A432V2L2_9HYPH|nr:pyrroline-5-carboxylate reductase dimerization domain-containing protein [Pseudaminobacter arsenicus]RUM96340.1 hypothetical protein EET67_18505 [Pseudaminobacter arsenicus]